MFWNTLHDKVSCRGLREKQLLLLVGIYLYISILFVIYRSLSIYPSMLPFPSFPCVPFFIAFMSLNTRIRNLKEYFTGRWRRRIQQIWRWQQRFRRWQQIWRRRWWRKRKIWQLLARRIARKLPRKKIIHSRSGSLVSIEILHTTNTKKKALPFNQWASL